MKLFLLLEGRGTLRVPTVHIWTLRFPSVHTTTYGEGAFFSVAINKLTKGQFSLQSYICPLHGILIHILQSRCPLLTFCHSNLFKATQDTCKIQIQHIW